ncbi:MAG TPA: lytic transglycosylase domain-containing protein [Solirubrobacteraceae bacterium]|jgi:membrane-bound lytic murein transglycosylase B|nr:lytic transglycosylase domain-containing protein [Solirubrobacteraceae bacterium]
MTRRGNNLLGLALGAILLLVPATASAAESETIAPPPTVTTTVAEPAPETTPPPTEEATAVSVSAEAEPEVKSTQQQSSSSGAPRHHASKGSGVSNEAEGTTETGASRPRSKHAAVSPATLTPALPLALQGSISGMPNFFIEDFEIPPFLLPIFQAAGAAYGIPWQVLAAINEVETDYGRDLSVSSAGAEGWMQFLPSSWSGYGVDANGDGYKDPYNPADAIFAAARYLRAAGGDKDIRDAIFSYNHSQSYVSSVMLRAQLLGGTPSELLGAITGLTEARFPVHAAAHFADGFPSVKTASGGSKTVAGTTIYAAAGAPVIAAQDGEVQQIGDSPALGHFLTLRDAYGNVYTYAHLGDVASEYPVIEPRVNSTVSSQIEHQGPSGEPAPSGPATAGIQSRSPLSEGATVSGLALGAAAGLEPAPETPKASAPEPVQPTTPQTVAPHVKAFREGSNEIYLHQLHAGVQVIAGTVLGHVGDAASDTEGPPHIIFQIRPAGPDAPLIDPKPVLDGWVALENSSVFHAKGENPFLATSPTIGQVLLESKQQLEPQVLHDGGIRLARCGRQDIRAGRVDKRVLAALEYLSVSGFKPTVAGLACAPATPAALASNATAGTSEESVSITAVNGVPVAGHQGPGTTADTMVRRLLMLQGLSRPRRIVSAMSYPGAAGTVTSKASADAISVAFQAPHTGLAKVAGIYSSALAPTEWSKLIARLGEIPDPSVSPKPSSAAIPDTPASGKEAGGNR